MMRFQVKKKRILQSLMALTFITFCLQVFLAQTNTLSLTSVMNNEREQILRQTVKFNIDDLDLLTQRSFNTTTMRPIARGNDTKKIEHILDTSKRTQRPEVIKNTSAVGVLHEGLKNANFTKAPTKAIIQAATNAPKNITANLINQTVAPPSRPFSAIINSYMRGGSSFVGRLLGFHPDSFYFYEPLNKFLLWEYFQAKSQLCHTNLCVCRNGKAFATTFMRHLVNVMHCKGFRDVTSADVTDFYSGKSWENFTKCFKAYKSRFKRKIQDPPDHCLFDVQQHCTTYKHVISKVLRLTLDNYDAILRQTSAIKLFHLYRDPRAVMNSRLKTDWFPVNSTDEVKSNARCLCIRMKRDYNDGLKLAVEFPDRFKFLMYEDIVDNMHEKADMLYEMLGLRKIKSIGLETFEEMASYGISTDHKLRDNSTDYTTWWRRTMPWNMVAEVNKYCADVIDLLGYTVFNNESELRNLSIPHVKIPYRFTIS